MKVIGLTGGVGSGKSTIANIIVKNFNVYAIYTDDIARRQMQRGGSSYDGVVKEFGEGILGDDKEIDRKKLALTVFADENKLLRLNELTHPQVQIEVQEIIESLKEEGNYQAVLVETALLIEAGYVSFCDEVWYVYAPMEDRRKRLRASRGYTDEKMNDIFSKQKSDLEYRRYCTNIIYNEEDTSEEDIIRQIIKIL